MNAQALLCAVKQKVISPDDFVKNLWKISNNNTRKGRRYRGTAEKPVRIYRATVFSEQTLPENIQRYSYPSELYATLGRANLPGKPVFYACVGAPTAFVESRCSVNDIVVISEFRVSSDVNLQEIGFKNSETPSSDYENLLNEIFTFPGNEFYLYSSCIASHLMTGTDIHGITYPSIISQNQSQNVALKTDCIDSMANFVNATAYKVTAVIDKFKYNVDEVNFGVKDGDGVCWKGRRKKWTIASPRSELKMVSNGWTWDAFDELGMLVDPE